MGATVSREPLAPGRPRVLTKFEVNFLCRCVKRRYDIALAELQTELHEVCAVEASLQMIARSLQRQGYTMKTITRSALEQNEKEREEFRTLIDTDFRLEQLVFADESRSNRLGLGRPYAWSIRGERATHNEFFLWDEQYSMLPAISLDGLLHLEVVEDAITVDDFRQFIQGLLPRMNKWPLPNSVLVIDDSLVHKVNGIREMVEERGARLLYLPAHSPDFNPVDLAFSTTKKWLRTNRDRVNQELRSENGVYNAFRQAVHSVTAEHAKEWYKLCGYYMLD